MISSGSWNRAGLDAPGPGSDQRDEGSDRQRRQQQRAAQPPGPGVGRLPVARLERDLGPDLGQVGIDIALVDHLGAVGLGLRELEGLGRLVLDGSARKWTSQVRSESIMFASLSGSNLETERPWSSVFSSSKPGRLDVEDRVELGHQAPGRGLDLEDQLAVLGLALVQALGDLELLVGPRPSAWPAWRPRRSAATRPAGSRSRRCP